MKNCIISTLLIILMSCTVVLSQTKNPTTTKKPETTVKSTAPNTTTNKKPSTPVVKPPLVERETTTTTTTTTLPSSTSKPSTSTSSTTTIQSSGPSKGVKVKDEKVNENDVEVVKEPSSNSGGVRFGIRAEVSQFVSFKTGADVSFSPGFNAGLIVNIPLSETFAIQPEVLYAMNVQQSNEIAGTFERLTTGSILTPVTLNISLGKSSTKFMVNIGGYANYYLSSTVEKTFLKVKVAVSNDLTGTDRFSYGSVLGLGVKLNKSILIEARSFYDLKYSNNKAMVTTLGVGYLF